MKRRWVILPILPILPALLLALLLHTSHTPTPPPRGVVLVSYAVPTPVPLDEQADAAENARLEALRVAQEAAEAENARLAEEAAERARAALQRPMAPAPRIAPSGDILDQLAFCESGGNPATNTGNNYFGAFQFLPSTWRGIGYEGLPTDHPYEVQREAAQALIERSGWGQFPGCARMLGML